MIKKISAIAGGAALILSAAIPSFATYRSPSPLNVSANVNYAQVSQLAQAESFTGGNINVGKGSISCRRDSGATNRITTGAATSNVNNLLSVNSLTTSGSPTVRYGTGINANVNVAYVEQTGVSSAGTGENRNVKGGSNTITTGSATSNVNQTAYVNNLQVNGLN